MRQNQNSGFGLGGIPRNGEAADRFRAPSTGRAPSPGALAGRVVALVTFGDNLPKQFLGEKIAQTVRDETGESVLLVQLTPASGPTASAGAWGPSALLAGAADAQAALPRNNGSISSLTLRVSDGAGDAGEVAELLRLLGGHYACVVVRGDFMETPRWRLLDFASLADSVYLCMHPEEDQFRRCESFTADLRPRLRTDPAVVSAVLCLGAGESLGSHADFCDTHAHVFLHECPVSDYAARTAAPAEWFLKDVRRLAREIGRCRLGLALSAGGAKGLAHIGVIQILEENGIEVDIIAGCSMGAYIAAAWASGCDGPTLEKLARENEALWGFLRLIDPVILPRQGFLQGDAVRRRLENTLGGAHFADLARPMRAVATNLDTLDCKVFASGQVTRAVQASCAIPGVVMPVTLGGETYVDGGVSDPLPVDVLAEMKVDRIIAVNAIPPSAFLRCCREIEREQAEVSRQRFKLLKALNRQVNYFARGNILDIMMRAVHGGQIRMAERACQQADLVLRPLAIDAHWHDFNHPGKYIALGRKIALQHLDEIKALAQPKAPRHESESAHLEMASAI